MIGQMTIFDMGVDFCSDSDINDVVQRLDDMCRKYNLEHDKPDFRTWGHVPQYGKRLTYTFTVPTGMEDNVLESLRPIAEDMSRKSIEFSVSPGFGGIDRGYSRFYCYTTYMDKRRKS